MTSRETILTHIHKHGPVPPGAILDTLEIGEQMLYRHLKKLIHDGLVEKIGTPPKVFYRVARNLDTTGATIPLDKKLLEILDKNFYHISARGDEFVGAKGFAQWCGERGFDLEKRALEFSDVVTKYDTLRDDGLLNATAKMRTTFPEGSVDELYYHDFYSVEIFGKTKMGQKLLYAKQSEDRRLMRDVAQTIRPALQALISRGDIDAVAYVPPTVPRGVQLMKVIEKELALGLPTVTITKIISDIRVPQKTLRKLADRIENAQETFVVVNSQEYATVLLIDDAVGSGASINEIAAKLKRRGVAQRVIGFAITGSLNDFDVISEV